jgi:predicted regulator of Ras-like GTPase activity (Roadblock/LC7/MglB family)
MSGLGLTEAQKMKKMSQILMNLKNEGNLIGVVFAERNGRLISKVYDNDYNFEEFSSMCASVLESVLSLSSAMGDQKMAKIITELESTTILIFECDAHTFLILAAKSDSKVTQIMDKLEEYKKKILFLY